MHFRGEDPVGKRIRLINDGNIPGAPKFYAGHGRRRVADDPAAQLRAPIPIPSSTSRTRRMR